MPTPRKSTKKRAKTKKKKTVTDIETAELATELNVPTTVAAVFEDAEHLKVERLLLQIENGDGASLTEDEAELIKNFVGGRAASRSVNPSGNFRKPRVEFTDVRKMMYLDHLATTAQKQISCQRAGISYDTLLAHRKKDVQFKAAEERAIEIFVDNLEVEATRRAVEGVAKPIYHKGQLVGTEQVYSDPLLMMLLKSKRPDKFRESHKVEVEHSGGVLLIPSREQSADDWQTKYGDSAALGSPQTEEKDVTPYE